MSTHTPGPWRVETDGDIDDQGKQIGPWPWRIVGRDGVEVVDFSGGTDVSEADACLMAAAPDLLAALKALATNHDDVHGYCVLCDAPPEAFCHEECPQVAATRAIEKAEGRTP